LEPTLEIALAKAVGVSTHPLLKTGLFDERHGSVRDERPVRRILVRTMWPPKGVTHDTRERQLHDEDRSCGSDPRIPE
jgi:hypothetical protein